MAWADSGVINFSHLTLTLVYRCNYRCPSCFLGDKLDSQESITFEEAVRIIDAAAELETIRAVAFTGGEPFLVYPLMLQVAQYIHDHYGVVMTASTNASWATDPETARATLGPLAELGLRRILLSWDDFHARFGQIEHVAHAVQACKELGVRPSIQNIYLRASTPTRSIKEALEGLTDCSDVQWLQNPCIPVGLGEQIPEYQQPLRDIDSVPFGRCSAGTFVNVQANGDVKPCCGAGLMADRLTMGTIKEEPVETIVRRASTNPLFNSLVAYKGPKHLIALLRSAGRSDLIPEQATDTCDACYRITTSPEAMAVLDQALEAQRIQLLLSRVASEEFSEPRPFLVTEPGESVYRNVPNFEAAEPVPALSVETPRREQLLPYLRWNEPLLIRSEFVEQSVPVQRWSAPGYLKDKAGDSGVNITHGLLLDKTHHETEMTFAEYLDAISEHSRNDRPIYMRLKEVPAKLWEDLDELLQVWNHLACNRRPVFGKGDLRRRERNPFIGAFMGRHTYTDSHEHGGFEALLIQVAGTKEILLHQPTDNNTGALYAKNRWSPVRFFRPDLEAYPLFRDNKPTYTKVHPGELLFIPDGWYHSVASQNDGLNITLTYFFPVTPLDLPAATARRAQPAQAL